MRNGWNQNIQTGIGDQIQKRENEKRRRRTAASPPFETDSRSGGYLPQICKNCMGAALKALVKPGAKLFVPRVYTALVRSGVHWLAGRLTLVVPIKQYVPANRQVAWTCMLAPLTEALSSGHGFG